MLLSKSVKPRLTPQSSIWLFKVGYANVELNAKLKNLINPFQQGVAVQNK